MAFPEGSTLQGEFIWDIADLSEKGIDDVLNFAADCLHSAATQRSMHHLEANGGVGTIDRDAIEATETATLLDKIFPRHDKKSWLLEISRRANVESAGD